MSEYRPASSAQSVLKWARERPDAPAVLVGGQTHTYAQLAGAVATLARRLIVEGARPGVIVGLQCGNSLWTLLLQLAVEVAGAAWLPLEPAELIAADDTARRCQMFLVEAPGEGLSRIGKVLRVDRDFMAQAQRPAAAPEDIERLGVARGADHVYAVARTSGTTGKPKFIQKLLGRLAPSVAKDDAITGPVAGDYAFIMLYRPTIMGVYGNVFRALQHGNTIAILTLDDLVSFGRSRQAYLWILTGDAERLAATCRAGGVDLDLYFVDVVGSAVSQRLHDAMSARLSRKIVNVYSSNETGPIASLEADGSYAVVDGIEVRVVDDAGLPLPAGAVGRIEVGSAQHAIGYLWDDALNARHVRDHWFLMNDLGMIPAPGRLRVVGRMDEMLNLGGVKVPPGPIEDDLRALEGVRDAVLLPMEDERGVGRFCVAIEPRPGVEARTLLPPIRSVVARTAPSYVLHFEAAFPRTDTGKVQRSLLLARVEAGLRRAAERAVETA